MVSLWWGKGYPQSRKSKMFQINQSNFFSLQYPGQGDRNSWMLLRVDLTKEGGEVAKKMACHNSISWVYCPLHDLYSPLIGSHLHYWRFASCSLFSWFLRSGEYVEVLSHWSHLFSSLSLSCIIGQARCACENSISRARPTSPGHDLYSPLIGNLLLMAIRSTNQTSQPFVNSTIHSHFMPLSIYNH